MTKMLVLLIVSGVLALAFLFHFAQSAVHSPKRNANSQENDEGNACHHMGLSASEKEPFHGGGEEMKNHSHFHWVNK
jgi:hypothetical protein